MKNFLITSLILLLPSESNALPLLDFTIPNNSFKIESKENTFSNTQTKFTINKATSWVKIYSQKNEFFSTEYTSTEHINFGGEIEVNVYENNIYTLYNGTPRSPITIKSISLHFINLDLPEITSGFSPNGTGSYNLLEDSSLLGYKSNICNVSWALGYDCSASVYTNGTEGALSGSFDGEKLSVNGSPPHVWFPDTYYEFHVEATVVPVPASFPLFFTGLLWLGMKFKKSKYTY